LRSGKEAPEAELGSLTARVHHAFVLMIHRMNHGDSAFTISRDI
jgi:hypothetical protein